MIADDVYTALKYLEPIQPGMECERIESVIGDPWYFCPESPNQGCTETFEEKYGFGSRVKLWEMTCNGQLVMEYDFEVEVDDEGEVPYFRTALRTEKINSSKIYNSST